MATRLFDIAVEYRQVLDVIELNGGEVTPEMEAALAEIEGSLEAKIDACCAVVEELESDEASQRKQAKRYTDKARVAANAQSNLKDYIRRSIKAANERRVTTPLNDVWIQKNPPSAKWTGDPDKIPADYRIETTDVRFDANKALKHHAANFELPAGVEVTQGESLRIR